MQNTEISVFGGEALGPQTRKYPCLAVNVLSDICDGSTQSVLMQHVNFKQFAVLNSFGYLETRGEDSFSVAFKTAIIGW
jgi:hypothetical protein